jgi:hypothetical protein
LALNLPKGIAGFWKKLYPDVESGWAMHGAIFGAYRSPALSFLYLLKNCFKRFRLDMIPDFCDLILTVLELYLRQCHPLVDLSEPEERAA